MATEDLPQSMKKSNAVSETKKNGITLLKSPVESSRKSAGNGDTIEEGKVNETEASTEPGRATENLGDVKAYGGNREGGRREVKGKRKITTTLIETFSSPASTSSDEKPLTQSTNSTSIATEKTRPLIQPDSRSSSTSPGQPATVETRLTGQTSFTTARQAGGEKETSKSPEKKPRRVQFQTLSQNSNLSSENESQTETPPLFIQEGSSDLRPQSCDPGSAHSSASSNETELMDVQTVE